MAVLDSGWPGNRRVVSLARNLESPFFDSRWPQGNRDTATEPSWSARPTVSVDRGTAFPQTVVSFAQPYLTDPDSIVAGISLVGNDLPEVSYDYATDTLTIASDPGADFTDSMQLRARTAVGSYDSPAFVVRDAALTNAGPVFSGSSDFTLPLIASRIEAVAPAHIVFDLVGTTHTSGVNTFHELGYLWRYGEPTRGNWPNYGTGPTFNKDRCRGYPIAGTVYENPGTFTVKCRVLHPPSGTWAQVDQNVTILDPNVVYGGTDTVCISTGSDMSGAPAGAQLIQNATGWPSFEAEKRYLLRRGDDFRSFGGITLGPSLGAGQIGAFGSGAKPHVQGININHLSSIWNQMTGSTVVEGWTFYDLRCATGTLVGLQNDHNLFLRVDWDLDGISQTGSGSFSFGQYTQVAGSESVLKYPRWLGVVECTSLAVSGPGVNMQLSGHFQGGLFLGNDFANQAEHCMRLFASFKTLVAYNRLYGVSDAARLYLKNHSNGPQDWTALRQGPYLDGSDPGYGANGLCTQWTVHRGNVCGDSGSVNNQGTELVSQNTDNASFELIQDSGIEENIFLARDLNSEAILGGPQLGARGIVNEVGTPTYNTTRRPPGQDGFPVEWGGPYFVSATQIATQEPV